MKFKLLKLISIIKDLDSKFWGINPYEDYPFVSNIKQEYIKQLTYICDIIKLWNSDEFSLGMDCLTIVQESRGVVINYSEMTKVTNDTSSSTLLLIKLLLLKIDLNQLHHVLDNLNFKGFKQHYESI